jgi:hypothetical protein
MLAVLAGPALALEPPVGADQAFVDAFAAACVPGRLSYEATRDTALAEGWAVVERTDHPELASVMQKADEMLAADPEFDSETEVVLLARDVNGTRHHLSVSRLTFIVEEGDDPWVMVGCHLYNFDATTPVDPAPVTALIGNPISRSHDQDGLIGHVWGPPCPMPRTGDTYLSFVAEGSPTSQLVGFAGVSLNFSTSTPDPGEQVPETYC